MANGRFLLRISQNRKSADKTVQNYLFFVKEKNC